MDKLGAFFETKDKSCKEGMKKTKKHTLPLLQGRDHDMKNLAVETGGSK